MNKAPAQRCNLAILFSDLCDSTGIAGGLEPEQYDALLGALRAVYDRVIERHGGLIVRIDGDGLLCAFGYPQALEDAGRRAAEAALDLHRAVAGLELGGAPVRLHSGIHAGVVLVREGDMVRGRIEVLGDATNLAARLCDAAGVDQILVSAASLGGDRHFFSSAGEVAVPIKGRKAPVPALLVAGREAVGTRLDARIRRGTAPFCGRQAELTRLRGLLDEVRGGGSRRVMVWGQPGIGKTRLLGEFLAEAAATGVPVLRGYCEAYLGAGPLQPFEQIARALGREGAAPAALLDWARGGDGRPAVLAIDDWQWADDASAVLLEEVARLRSGGLLVLLASRPEGVAALPGEAIERIELGPLSHHESDSAIAALLRGADPFRVERIRELAGGSPLYIEELCHAQSARLPGDEPSESHDGSAWLDALVTSRFRSLGERPAALVRAAAVIGHMVPIGLFAAVTGVAEDDPVLAELSESDFVHRAEVGNMLRFKHALTRDAIYRTVGLDERMALHGLVAERLEALAAAEGEDSHVDALAYHHAACGNAERALVFALKAGEKALESAALDRAQSHFELAFSLKQTLSAQIGDEASLAKLISGYGRACVIDPSRNQVEVLGKMVAKAELGGNVAEVALARYWLGTIHFGLGDARVAIGGLETALAAALKSGRPYLAAQINATLGASWFDIGEPGKALELLESAIAVLERQLTASRMPVLLYAKANIAQIQADRGDFGQAAEIFAGIDAAMADSRVPVNSSLLTQRATVFLWQGDFDRAQAAGEGAELAGKRVRSRQNAMYGRALRLYARFKASGDTDAASALIDVLDWLFASPYRHRVSLFYGWGAEVSALTGQTAQCRRWSSRAFARYRAGDSFGTASAARAMALVAASKGNGNSAAGLLAIAERTDRDRMSRWSAEATQQCRAQLKHLLPVSSSR